MEVQERRAMLTARKLVQKEFPETEPSLRAVLRGFGLKVRQGDPGAVRWSYQELVAGHPVYQCTNLAN
jgi:transposase